MYIRAICTTSIRWERLHDRKITKFKQASQTYSFKLSRGRLIKAGGAKCVIMELNIYVKILIMPNCHLLHPLNTGYSEAVIPRCSVKKLFLKISQNSQKKPAPEFLFNKAAAHRLASLLKSKPWHRCFPVSFTKFLRTPFL